MPSTGKEQGPEKGEGSRQGEREQSTYYRAARFENELASRKAYFEAQAALFRAPECDLSSYRIQLNRVWHVLVVGEKPPEELDDKLHSILSTGEPAPLPADLLAYLKDRRARATRLGPWVERHFREEGP